MSATSFHLQGAPFGFSRQLRAQRILVGSLISLVMLSIFSLTSAQAHTALVASSPVVESQITTWPDSVVLTFGEDLAQISGQKINFLTVTNAHGDQVNSDLSTVKKNVLTSQLLANVVEGPVLVNYRIAALDGHVIEGEYTFRFGKGSEVSQSPSPVPLTHHASNNLGIYASSTILIVIALLFGFWTYRKSQKN
ncbi:MAG: copper resistance CopC family protein [Actinomycetes bacterium]